MNGGGPPLAHRIGDDSRLGLGARGRRPEPLDARLTELARMALVAPPAESGRPGRNSSSGPRLGARMRSRYSRQVGTVRSGLQAEFGADGIGENIGARADILARPVEKDIGRLQMSGTMLEAARRNMTSVPAASSSSASMFPPPHFRGRAHPCAPKAARTAATSSASGTETCAGRASRHSARCLIGVRSAPPPGP